MPAAYKVVLTEDAQADLEAIYEYIAEHDSPENADYVLDELLKAAENLGHFPDKGSVPKELQSLGNRDYRQAFFKPYRLIYRVINKQVVVFLITDGRCDMQTLLARRLLS
ncbi:type II toxin-antitoxin system RelE/ParE family toxin [Candidatus Schmidhempelia bombi]|uniref:Type II toxin-antitoxin system RelE/ParE family toxin n=1 Tax=Candidatus Schmidhempelia bombi str. Bimp TaxID=1387197 RepID=A0AB94IDQ7_9GAMM|nr:type II toxin-antitoxin system RelE/ParE family toxin [Candidatus Schmidhempelia bombi]TEA27599.1 type II toxin-antitoxin system RelE/ParE family toxin [Candidatus Schmidhempelia bombi str. Bimp]